MTTVPPMVISIVIFTVLGFRQTSGGYNPGDLNVYIDYLEEASTLAL